MAREKYFSLFRAVETQVTFYQPSRLATLTGWREEAPGDFEFVVKAWQLITHSPSSPAYRRLRMKISESKRRFYGDFKPTDEVLRAWDVTLECVKALGASAVLFQSPPAFGPTALNKSNMKKFFKKIKREDLTCIWEPRGAWVDSMDEIEKMCLDLDLVHCVIDPFTYRSTAGKIDYFRLHGKVRSGRIDYKYRYRGDELRSLRDMCGRAESYCMFNNSAVREDALRFSELV
jgi:uncharacterized protein YecE (DUF72 family)